MGRLKIALLAFAVLALAGFSWLWFAPCGFGGCAPVSQLERFQAEGSQLLDVEGTPFATLATVNRRVVPLDSLPDVLTQAFLAVEDRRFYGHGGVDWRRFAGALAANVRRGGVTEGGSTITMQLARNLFPEHLPYRERSPRRKLMEIRVARQIERAFAKDKILELYVNHIYLGEGSYGVEAASRTYFGKSASELTLAEAAVLGGLPQSPSRINPRENMEAAQRRRNLVLREMADAGFVTAAEAEAASAEPIELARGTTADERNVAAYFVERVRRELEERVGNRFYTAGLRVHTTLDPVAQAAAEEEIRRQAEAIESGAFGAFRHPTYANARGEVESGATTYLQAGAVVMDASTGAVLALVSGRDYDDSKFDRIYQGQRQPGSAFKPYVYLAALERAIPASRTMEDAPVRITLAGGRAWEPRNYTGRYDGPITLRDALARSKNTVAVRLAQEVGISTVAQTARELGITTDIPGVPSMALGAGEVRPIELVTSYAAFANGGNAVRPYVVRRVEDRNGRVLYEAAQERRQVVDPAVAFVLTSMLRDVVDRGTGTPVRTAGFRGPAAGKTGTTNGATDIWFVGYTPELVGAVWFGMDRPATIVRGASGGTIAAPVWGRMMSRIYRNRPMPPEWSPPPGVVTEAVDRVTGLAVDEGCPQRGETYTEYFVRNRPPRQPCPTDVWSVYAAGDSGWFDEEWGALYEPFPDTAAGELRESGIEWPELEEMRRRGETEAARAPLPGEVVEPSRGPPGTQPPAEPAPARGTDTARAPSPSPARDTARTRPREEPRLLGEPVQPAPPDTAGGAPGDGAD